MDKSNLDYKEWFPTRSISTGLLGVNICKSKGCVVVSGSCAIFLTKELRYL